MMIVEFVVRATVFTLLGLGVVITAVTAAMLLSAFVPAAAISFIQSRFTHAHPKISI